MSHVFPILTPMNVDPAHPFPFIQNKGLTLAVEMANREDKAMNGLIPIPAQVDRFIRLPASASEPKIIRFIRMETVIGLFISELYPNFSIKSQGAFRVLRDSDIEFQEEAEDLTRAYEIAAQAPPPRHRDPARDRGGDADSICAASSSRSSRSRRSRSSSRMACSGSPTPRS